MPARRRWLLRSYELRERIPEPSDWRGRCKNANGQVLTQAFEGPGTVDREAVTEYLKNHTFKTVIDEIDLRTQLQNIAYTVGQRQNGFFRSAFAVGVADSELVPVQAKSGWV
jgi:branched-chain amino acid transport system substrate-binding protein